MPIKPRFQLGDIVEISYPPSKRATRFVVSDFMPNGVDVYFHDETGQRGCSARLGHYRLIHRHGTTSRRLKKIDEEIANLLEERDSLIENRLRFKEDEEEDLFG